MLHYAVEGGSPQIVAMLLMGGRPYDAATSSAAHTPLHLAARKGHANLLPYLLAVGPQARDACSACHTHDPRLWKTMT